MKRCCLLFVIFIQSAIAEVHDVTLGSDTLRAIYLYKIGLYVSTRKDNNAIKIGVFGDDAIIRLLNKLRGEKGFQHRYQVQELDPMEPEEKYPELHVFYLPGRFYDEHSMQKLMKRQILVVGNEEFCWVRNYHICLFQDDSKLKFKANISQMNQNGIQVSSKLLRLAVETR